MPTCGIGDGIVYPNDPNNNSILTAVAQYKGIRVSWSYPSVNPQAVTHVKVFRSGSATFGSASQIATAKGDNYFDNMDDSNDGLTFYYWIQIVSINGTEGNVIGPASATFTSSIDQILAELNGRISSSELSAALAAEIPKIATNASDILNEGVVRSSFIDGLEIDLNAMGIDVTGTFTAIANEQTQRQDGDTALAGQISAVIASNGVNLAAIVDEEVARVDAVNALAARMTTAEASVVSTDAATDAVTLRVDGHDTDISNAETDINNLETDVANVPNVIDAAFQSSFTAQVGYCLINGELADSTQDYAKDKDLCNAENGGEWIELRALADAVRTVQVSDNNGSATLEEKLVAHRTVIGDYETSYTVKLQADQNGAGNELVQAGFGLYAGADESSAGFNVDTFWVGDVTANNDPNNLKPFIISGGKVYIEDAVVRTASIGDLQVTNAQIDNLTVGTSKITDDSVSGAFYHSVNTTNYKFTPNSGWSSTPGSFTVPTSEVGDSAGFVYLNITLAVDYTFSCKDVVAASPYGASSWTQNYSPLYLYVRIKYFGSYGNWSSLGQMGGVWLINGSDDGTSFAAWGGNTAASRTVVALANAEYQFRMSTISFGPLTTSQSNSYFDWGTIDSHSLSVVGVSK